MIRLKWLVISALFAVVNAKSESKWIRMQSPNFDAYSSAGERETRDDERETRRELRHARRHRGARTQNESRRPTGYRPAAQNEGE